MSKIESQYIRIWVSADSQWLRQTVLLATAQVLVDLKTSSPYKVRVLIDPGSELSFILERTVNLLRLTRKHASIPISGIGSVSSGYTRGRVHLTLKSTHSNLSTISVQCYILPQLTSWLPHTTLSRTPWPHLTNINLADPNYFEPGPNDIILGTDSYGSFIRPRILRQPSGKLIAQETLFGWIILGPVSQRSPLPLKSSVDLLDESRILAERRMERLIRRFDKDPIYKDLYCSFMNEFKTLKHIRKISPISVEPPLMCYIPHHGIAKLKNGIQKIRVVFNGSSRTSSNPSLNDILHTGQKLQIDITDTLLYLRSHRFVFLTDIGKMFRQILIHPDDWDLQRILWVNSQK